MLFTRQRMLSALLLVGLAILSAFAQTPAPKEPEKESNYIEHKDFKSKVIEVKHRDAFELMRALSVMGSGAKGASIVGNAQLRILTIRDYPENVAAIEDAVKRLDVPEPPRSAARFRDIELTAYVLIASKQESPTAQYPAPLKDVVTQLQNTLGFKSYYLLTPFVQRTGSVNGRIESNGVAPLTLANQAFNARYYLSIVQVGAANRTATDPGEIVFKQLNFQLRCDPATPNLNKTIEVKIATELTVKDGEKVVVGTASLDDSALVLVIMARWLN